MAGLPALAAQPVIAIDIGPGLIPQGKSLRGIDIGRAGRLAVDQSVQDIQHMGLGRNPGFQSQFHGGQHGLFIVLQHQGQHLGHFPIAPAPPEQMMLELAEGIRHLGEGSPDTQGAGLSLDDGQVVPPVKDCPSWCLV